jgi:hypothetical protein
MSKIVLKDHGLHSVSFPLISSVIFGDNLPNPVVASTKQCSGAYSKFIANFPDYFVDVKLWAFSSKKMRDAQTVFDSMT